MMDNENLYYLPLVAAYVRGMDILSQKIQLPPSLAQPPLEDLTMTQYNELFTMGKAAGLDLFRFKKTHETLPRIQRLLGFLRGNFFDSLLDIGTGRGVFLWPLLAIFPNTKVTACDLKLEYENHYEAVRKGGFPNLDYRQEDFCQTTLPEKSYDAVTLLEVLEHMPDPYPAIEAAVRIARRFIAVSVPSKEDDNPEHLHLLTQSVLTEMFTRAGCSRLKFGIVTGHLILFATVR